MRQRLQIVVLSLALAVSGAAFAQDAAKKSDGPQPLIEIPRMKHDFGEVFERDKYEYTFTVRNRGKADLVIEDVKPG